MEDISVSDIRRITAAINCSTGIDFSNYAFSSFKRRIMRFTEINRIRNMDSFTERIYDDIPFANSLIKDITVNVTEMFRDPSFWVVLRDMVLPGFSNNSEIKIWHAACSTGEEVYSMSILLHESGLLDRSRIIATDLNDGYLNVAENGLYSQKSQDRNSKNYDQYEGKSKLTDYYTLSDKSVQYHRSLVKNVDFRVHNLAKDPPFAIFDIILCRNVLIYFNSELQEKVIQTFDQSMACGSFLAIGSKESLRWSKVYRRFSEENPEEKIYRKREFKKNHCQFNEQ